MPPDNRRHATPPRRRAKSLRTNGGANPDDAASANINTLIAQYTKNGTMPAVHIQQPLAPSTIIEPATLHDAYEQIQAANDRFNELPADVRTAADNDPVKFLEMVADDNQRVLLESAGLLVNHPTSTNTDPPTTSLSTDGVTAVEPATNPTSEPTEES